MRIKEVKSNNRKKAFEVLTAKKAYGFPYAKLEHAPTRANPIKTVFVDRELGGEAFTYLLASGEEGSVHIDQVLEYNEDPGYLRDLVLYKLTLEAQNRLESSPLSKREIIRRLGTSATQFYRILDQTNRRKSIDQVLGLLHVLECDVDLVVRDRNAHVA